MFEYRIDLHGTRDYLISQYYKRFGISFEIVHIL